MGAIGTVQIMETIGMAEMILIIVGIMEVLVLAKIETEIETDKDKTSKATKL